MLTYELMWGCGLGMMHHQYGCSYTTQDELLHAFDQLCRSRLVPRVFLLHAMNYTPYIVAVNCVGLLQQIVYANSQPIARTRCSVRRT